MTDVLEVSTDGGLRVLRLNRPDRKNALNQALLRALDREFRAAALDDGVRAVVLTGNGDGFCSGADIGDQTLKGASESKDTDPPVPGSSGAYLTLVMRVECE